MKSYGEIPKYPTAVNLPESLVLYYSKHHGLKKLYAYAINVIALKDKGYARKQEYIQKLTSHAKITTQTAYRWLKFFKQEGCVIERDGMIYQIGKKNYARKLNLPVRMYFRCLQPHMRHYKTFAKWLVLITGIRQQNRFRYHIKRICKNGNCHVVSSLVEFPIVPNPKAVGCAQNHLSKKMGLSKGTVNYYLRGHLTHNFKKIKDLTKEEIRFMVAKGVLRDNPRLKLMTHQGHRVLCYQLPSTIHLTRKSEGDNRKYKTSDYIILR